jgi:hypothetical protein
MAKTSEQAIGEAVLKILSSCPGGTATIRKIKELIPTHINLSSEDCIVSPTRKGEQLWEQQVRNIVSHRKSEGNIICEGLVEYKPGRLTLTDAGFFHVKNSNKSRIF